MPTNARVREVLQRADISLSDLTSNGGLLQPEQADSFIDLVLEQPTIMREIRVQRMTAPTMRINKIGFASRIMKAASQTGGADDDGTNTRHLAAADRSEPTTSKIELTSKEVMAEVHLPYEVLEDNIERGDLETHLMRLIAERAALDLEEWIVKADTASGDDYLALQDGLLKSATSNVVDVLNAGPTPDMYRDAQLAMPQKFLRNLSSMRFYNTVADTIRYRSNVAARATGYGDSALQTAGELVGFGVPIRAVPQMTADFGLFTFPQNIIFGIQRAIMVETERDIRARTLVVVLSTRIDVVYEDETAVVKLININ
jgi:hypothetical protein